MGSKCWIMEMYAFLHFLRDVSALNWHFGPRSIKRSSFADKRKLSSKFACFSNMPVIRVLNPTLPVPQASRYHHISILYVTLKITFHRDILIMFIIIYFDVWSYLKGHVRLDIETKFPYFLFLGLYTDTPHSDHGTMTKCRFNAGPLSTTLVQHWSSINNNIITI